MNRDFLKLLSIQGAYVHVWSCTLEKWYQKLHIMGEIHFIKRVQPITKQINNKIATRIPRVCVSVCICESVEGMSLFRGATLSKMSNLQQEQQQQIIRYTKKWKCMTHTWKKTVNINWLWVTTDTEFSRQGLQRGCYKDVQRTKGNYI